MPAGSKPGERRGGRKKGVPNKATKAREAEIAKKRAAEGQQLAKDVLAAAMNAYLTLADKYDPASGNQIGDEAKFDRYLSKAAAIAADLAPYESSKLQSTTIIGDRDKPVTHTLNVNFV